MASPLDRVLQTPRAQPPAGYTSGGRTPPLTADTIRARQQSALARVNAIPKVQAPPQVPSPMQTYTPPPIEGPRGATMATPMTPREREARAAMWQRSLGDMDANTPRPQPVVPRGERAALTPPPSAAPAAPAAPAGAQPTYTPPPVEGPRGATPNPPPKLTPREREAKAAMWQRSMGYMDDRPPPSQPVVPRGERAALAASSAAPAAPSTPAGTQPTYTPPKIEGPRGATPRNPPPAPTSKLATLGRAATGVGIAVEGYRAAQDMTPSGGLDTAGKVARAGEGLGRIGAAGVGAGLGALATPFFPPLGAVALGTAGYFAPEFVQGVGNMLGADIELPSQTAARNRAATAQARAMENAQPAATAPATAPVAPAAAAAPLAAAPQSMATQAAPQTAAPRLRDALTPVMRIGDMPLASAQQLQAGGYAVDAGQPRWNPQDPGAMDIINRQYDERMTDLRWMLGSVKNSPEQKNVLTKAIADLETQRGQAIANYGDNATKFSETEGENINNRRNSGQLYNQTLAGAANADNQEFGRRQAGQSDAILKAMDINATNDRYAMGDQTARRGQDVDLLKAAFTGGGRSTASGDKFDAAETKALADQFLGADQLPKDEQGNLTEDAAKELSARQQFFYRNMEGLTDIADPIARRARVEDLRREYGLSQAMNQALDQRGNPNPVQFTRPVRGQGISLGDWLDPMQPSAIDLSDVLFAGENDFVITQDGRKVPTRALGDMAGNVEAQASLMDAELRGLYGQLASLNPNSAEYNRVMTRINELTPKK